MSFLDDFSDHDLSILEAVGEEVTFTPQGGGTPVQITGVFEEEYVEINTGGSVGVAGKRPMFTYRTQDIASVQTGDSVTRSSRLYLVVNIEPTGDGMTTLILEDNGAI